jgi:hypothetical protein
MLNKFIFKQLKKRKKMKKQFLVIDLNDTSFSYIVDDLNSLITEMYECELERETLETVTGWFNENHKVVEIEGSINEIN